MSTALVHQTGQKHATEVDNISAHCTEGIAGSTGFRQHQACLLSITAYKPVHWQNGLSGQVDSLSASYNYAECTVNVTSLTC